MKKIYFLSSTALLVIAGVAILSDSRAADAGSQAKSSTALMPVEDDVHEFMEYAFEPPFTQLKASLSEVPKDNKVWKLVKASSLILAENGNLLMLRGPEEDTDTWNQFAAELRDQGKLLYQAAKKRDFDSSKKHYAGFVAKCNACHETFADGEHIQKP